MQKISTFVLGVLILSSVLFAQDVAKVKAKIEELNKVYTKAMLDNDFDKMLSMYTEDIISMPSYQPMVKGIEKVRELSNEQKKSGWKTTHFVLAITDVIVAGNLAIEIGNYDMIMAGPNMPEWADKGKYITIWELQNDGSTKIKVETWNTDSDPCAQMKESESKK
jgi:ketosteroid isomerase-like protein